mgnify:CR=1 FL=1|jgi:hypothetical protein
MDNQHKKIKGYRDLNQTELDLMNEGKELAETCRAFIEKLEGVVGTSKSDVSTDKRAVALAKTNLQQGFMWVTKSIARPDSF